MGGAEVVPIRPVRTVSGVYEVTVAGSVERWFFAPTLAIERTPRKRNHYHVIAFSPGVSFSPSRPRRLRMHGPLDLCPSRVP